MRVFAPIRRRMSRVRIVSWALLGCLAVAAVTASQSSGQRADPVHQLFQYVSPRPQSELVSSRTTIAVRPWLESGETVIKEIGFTVVGSQSGHHRGDLILADDRKTIIFRPDEAFAHEELVNVTIDTGSAFHAEGLPQTVSYGFAVSPPPPVVDAAFLEPYDLRPASSKIASPHPADVPVTTRKYMTAPADFPIFEVTTADGGIKEGYLFLGYFNYTNSMDSNAYLLILDNLGEPIFYRRLHPLGAAFDFKVQPNGLLTYYDPSPNQSKFLAMDDTYTMVRTYQAGNGYGTDLHDLQILDNGNALLMIYDARTVDMSQIVSGGDPEATVIGCIIQEVDPAGNVLFEWRSWDHISILDSNQDLTASFIRYIHCNSVEQDHDGNVMISSRNLDEVTKIDRQTGEIIWRLGGAQNDFTFTNDAGFFYQHDARRLPNGNISLYDNRWEQDPEYSRGVEYKLNEVLLTATRVWEFRNTPDTYGPFMGNNQRFASGDALIGWGYASDPIATEVTINGTKLFELSGEQNHGSYRTFRFPWQGHPTWPPVLVAHAEGSAVKLYFSWNGATEVVTYRIYAGRTPQPDVLVAVEPRQGFETTYVFEPPEEDLYYFRVQAVNQEGVPTQYSNSAAVLVGSTATYLPVVAR